MDSCQEKILFNHSDTKNLLLVISDTFGSSSSISKTLIEALVHKLLMNSSMKTLEAFNIWNTYLDLDNKVQKSKSRSLETTLGLYSKSPACTITKVLFAINTYVSMIMKLIGLTLVIDEGNTTRKPCIPVLKNHKQLQEVGSKEFFCQLENGNLFTQNNIDNFVNGTEIFSWYLDEWDEGLETLLSNCATEILRYSMKTGSTEKEKSFDIFSRFYLDLIPATIRKTLGEEYTPQWLVDFIVQDISPDIKSNQHIFDPSCGSGTFISQIINQVSKVSNTTIPLQEVLTSIQKNIVGFDINPLAVLIARTSFLYSISTITTFDTKITIPIFLTNSLYIEMINQKQEPLAKSSQPNELFNYIVSKNKENYLSKHILSLYNLFSYTPDSFYDPNRSNHQDTLYINILAPFYQTKFDLILGNPPWINWELLSEEQKTDYTKIYSNFNLQTHSRWKAKLGAGKYDLSALFIYIIIKNFLKVSSDLIFVIPASLLKGYASTGFRKFEYFIPQNGSFIGSWIPIKVVKIHDLSAFQPFPKRSTKTMIIHLRNGVKTYYPIDYIEWAKCRTITGHTSWNDIKTAFILSTLRCAPLSEDDSSSGLVTAKTDRELRYLQKNFFHKGLYQAFEGSNTEGFNAAFWITNLRSVKNNKNLVGFDNYNNRQKQVVMLAKKYFIEKELIFPLIRATNIKKWQYEIDTYIVYLPKYDEETIINEKKFEKTYPYAYEYLHQLEKKLENRRSYKKKSHNYPFYIFYGKKEMKSTIKVCWTRMSMLSAVVVTEIDHPLLGKKTAIPQETVVFIPVNNLLEAHYLCAILNSDVFSNYIRSFRVSGTKSFASPEIFDKITIPVYDQNQHLHDTLALLSLEAHTRTSNNQDLYPIQVKINTLTHKLFKTIIESKNV